MTRNFVSWLFLYCHNAFWMFFFAHWAFSLFERNIYI
jgi:hypothetical protein